MTVPYLSSRNISFQPKIDTCCFFQFSPVHALAHDTTSIAITHLQFVDNRISLKVLPISPMDQSSRNRMPHPPRPVSSVSSLPVEEPHTQTDQLGLIQASLQSGAPPTLVTGMAMSIAQMQTLEAHPDFTLSISVGIGSYRRTAELRNRTCQGHNLTHHFDDNRSNLPYSEPATPSPMVQQDSLGPDQQQTPPVTIPTVSANTGDNSSTLPVSTQQLTCPLPVIPPPVLTSAYPSASTSERRLHHNDPQLMFPSTFRGKG